MGSRDGGRRAVGVFAISTVGATIRDRGPIGDEVLLNGARDRGDSRPVPGRSGRPRRRSRASGAGSSSSAVTPGRTASRRAPQETAAGGSSAGRRVPTTTWTRSSATAATPSTWRSSATADAPRWPTSSATPWVTRLRRAVQPPRPAVRPEGGPTLLRRTPRHDAARRTTALAITALARDRRPRQPPAGACSGPRPADRGHHRPHLHGRGLRGLRGPADQRAPHPGRRRVHVWSSRTRAVTDGKVVFRIATRRTWGHVGHGEGAVGGPHRLCHDLAWRYAACSSATPSRSRRR